VAGDFLLASSESPGIWVLDPATGTPLGNFGAWQALGPAGNGRIYGKIEVPGENRIFYGVLDPATRRIRILGGGERVSGDCSATGDALVCRLVDASVAVWRLR
jgi:hypothetical protein